MEYVRVENRGGVLAVFMRFQEDIMDLEMPIQQLLSMRKILVILKRAALVKL